LVLLRPSASSVSQVRDGRLVDDLAPGPESGEPSPGEPSHRLRPSAGPNRASGRGSVPARTRCQQRPGAERISLREITSGTERYEGDSSI
jgi:hypothetical protein